MKTYVILAALSIASFASLANGDKIVSAIFISALSICTIIDVKFKDLT